MKDPRLVELKLRAEKDRKLSDGSARLLAMIVSDLYVNRNARPEDDFPLPWSLISRWTALSERHSYRRLAELQRKGYLKFSRQSGCPARNYYFLCLSSAKSGRTSSAEYGRTSSAKKGGHHISKGLRPKIEDQEGAKRPVRELVAEMREAVKRGH